MNSLYVRYIRVLLVPVLLAALTALVYSNSLDCAWQFDDVRSILEFDYANATPRTLFAFSPQRSLVFFTFWLNYRAGGYDVAGWHLANIAVHILNVWMIYVIAGHLLARALRRVPGAQATRYAWISAALVAALFAAHPVQTQAVTYVVQRLELMGTLWVLCAFYAAVRALESPQRAAQRGWAACAAAALMLGALSKEIIAAAPLLIAAYLLILHVRTWRARLLTVVWCGIIGLVLALSALVFFHALSFTPWPRLTFAPFVTLWQGFTPATYYPLQTRVLLLLLRLCFIPYGLRAEYELQAGAGWSDPRVLAALAVHFALLAGAACLWRRRPLALFGLVWFYAFLLPSSLMPNGVFEHRVYGALAGILIGVAGLLCEELLRQPAAYRRVIASVALGMCACIIVSFGFLTYMRNNVWRSEYTLWQDTVHKSPASWRANANYGQVLMTLGDYDDARPYLEKAFALNSNVYLVASNLGVLYFNLDEYARSAELFTYALRLKPGAPLLLYYLGAATARVGRFDEGTNLLQRARIPAAWTALGDLHYERGEFAPALDNYRRTLAAQPRDMDAIAGALRTLLALGDTNAAHALIIPGASNHSD